jgi:transposase
MEQRYQAVMAVQVDGLTVTAVAEKVGVSRQTVHGWLRRYEAGGLARLMIGRIVRCRGLLSPGPNKRAKRILCR